VDLNKNINNSLYKKQVSTFKVNFYT